MIILMFSTNEKLKLLNSFKSAQYQITVEHYSFYCYYLNLSRNSEFHVFTIFRRRVASSSRLKIVKT